MANADGRTGELEPDYEADVWADHDENCHGIIDSEAMRMEVPEGFVWDCCNKLGHRPGCTIDKHDVYGTRGRYGTERCTAGDDETDDEPPRRRRRPSEESDNDDR